MVLILCSLISSSSARMGYDIIASAGGPSFELHRSTQYMDFSLSGSVKGTGNFSRLSRITQFAGVSAKEDTSSAKAGALDYSEQVLLKAREGPVIVTINLESSNLTDDSNQTSNQTLVINSTSYITIDETWPTYFANSKKISYLGPGIRTRERYNNNGDVIGTFIDSWKLSKDSLYRSHLNRSITDIGLTPNSTYVERSTNRSSKYQLQLDSIGTSTHIDATQTSLNKPLTRISQDYVGSQNMLLKIGMDDSVIPFKDDDEWLNCCSVTGPQKL